MSDGVDEEIVGAAVPGVAGEVVGRLGQLRGEVVSIVCELLEFVRALGGFDEHLFRENFNMHASTSPQYTLIASLDVLRKTPGCTGRVGTVGFCLGGKLAYLMATRSDVDCAVAYYGVSIHQALGETGNIKKPLMLHIAENDKFVPKDAQDQIKAALGH